MSRIVIHEPRPGADPCADLLAGEGHDVVVCEGRESLFRALALRRPDLVIYVMDDPLADWPVLSAVRLAASTLPIILLGAAAALETRRQVQVLKPTYYGVFPLEPAELRDAVRGALGRAASRARTA